jgi:hypothetical protein
MQLKNAFAHVIAGPEIRQDRAGRAARNRAKLSVDRAFAAGYYAVGLSERETILPT